MAFNILLIVCGVFLLVSGIGTAFRSRAPMDAISAFLALAGLITSLVGVLLICVPDFFS